MIVAVTMVPDPNERIPEIEEVEAVACAVQSMYLTCAALGLERCTLRQASFTVRRWLNF